MNINKRRHQAQKRKEATIRSQLLFTESNHEYGNQNIQMPVSLLQDKNKIISTSNNIDNSYILTISNNNDVSEGGVNYYDNLPDEQIEQFHIKKSNYDLLREFYIQNNLTRHAGNELLKMIKQLDFGKVNELPKDIRTISEHQTNYDIYDMHPGQMVYFGIENYVKLCGTGFLPLILSKKLKLTLNIDGLPLFKSSKNNFWPILGKFECVNRIFIIALYFGEGKPENVNHYLEKCVHEIQILSKFGIEVNGTKYEFKLNNISADAPAKSYLLGFIGHNGYNSCLKCQVIGEYHGRVCFIDCNAPRRLTLVDQERRSIIFKIQGFDAIKATTTDYMHLICLGVVKKYLTTWLEGRAPIINRLAEKKINIYISKLQKYTPKELARKPRTLNDLKYWKANEYRQFLMYYGPVILKNVITSEVYENFVTLSVCTRILLCKEYCQDSKTLDEVCDVLKKYIAECVDIYGPKFITHNVHGLIHLPEEVKNFGVLDNFSCFKFEGYLGFLKKIIRSGNRPLEQICNKYNNICDSYIQGSYCTSYYCHIPEFSKQNLLDNGKMTFQTMNYKNMFFNVNSLGDSYCCLSGNLLVKIKYFKIKNGCNYIIGQQFKKVKNFFLDPISSTQVGIFQASCLEKRLQKYEVNLLLFKCYAMPMEIVKKEFILMRLLNEKLVK